MLSRGDLRLSVLRGSALASLAAYALAHLHGRAVFVCALFYGLGLGIAMTSISLLRAAGMGPRRGRELNRLNLLWALGALAAPALAAHALRTDRPAYLFSALSAALLAFAGLILLTGPQPAGGPIPQSPAGLLPAPWMLCAVSALIVGTEASLGAWLTAFSQRADASVGAAVDTATAFWAGLLLSRALHATAWLPAPKLWPYTAVLAPALLLLPFASAPLLLAALACLLGAALGPLYPLLLAVATARFRSNRAFLAAGLGSAVFPWLTGLVSAQAGSLRAGLAVPCAAGCLLLTLALRLGRFEDANPARRENVSPETNISFGL